MADRSIRYSFVGEDKSLGRTMGKLGEQSGSLHSKLGALTGVFAGGIVGAGAVDFLKSSIGKASDLNESLSKTRTVFGGASASVEAFAKTSATSLGQSQQQALEATSTFGNLFVALGLGAKPAADLSTKIVGLAGDLASFNNVDPAEALDALKSGLLGEAEPMRKFGVTLSAVRVNAEALADGLVKPIKNAAGVKSALLAVEVATKRVAVETKKYGANSLESRKAQDALAKATALLSKATKGSIPELTAVQKAQASYNIIMKDTKTAQGDFARTSGGLANQQRILKAEFSNVSSELGVKLLPAATAIVTALSNSLKPGSQFRDVLGDIAGKAKAFGSAAMPIFKYIGDHPKLFADLVVGAGGLAAILKIRSSLGSGISAVKGLVPGVGSKAGLGVQKVFVTNLRNGGLDGNLPNKKAAGVRNAARVGEEAVAAEGARRFGRQAILKVAGRALGSTAGTAGAAVAAPFLLNDLLRAINAGHNRNENYAKTPAELAAMRAAQDVYRTTSQPLNQRVLRGGPGAQGAADQLGALNAQFRGISSDNRLVISKASEFLRRFDPDVKRSTRLIQDLETQVVALPQVSIAASEGLGQVTRKNAKTFNRQLQDQISKAQSLPVLVAAAGERAGQVTAKGFQKFNDELQRQIYAVQHIPDKTVMLRLKLEAEGDAAQFLTPGGVADFNKQLDRQIARARRGSSTTVHTTVKVDGRAVAHAVSTHQNTTVRNGGSLGNARPV